MYCIDFEYDGHFLSEFSSIICSINGDTGIRTTSIGSNLTLNTIRNSATNRFQIISTQYDEVFSTTFQIGKYNCSNINDYIYSDLEVAAIMKWLNKKSYKRFKPIYDIREYMDIFYMGTFNLEVIKSGFDVIGFEVTFTTDAPYAYYETREHTFELNALGQFAIFSGSDEIGRIYPDTQITIKKGTSDPFTLINELDKGHIVEVFNVTNEEVLSFNGETKEITSTKHKNNLFNDFNFVFPRIITTAEEDKNVYTVSHDCIVKIKYTPICKTPII